LRRCQHSTAGERRFPPQRSLLFAASFQHQQFKFISLIQKGKTLDRLSSADPRCIHLLARTPAMVMPVVGLGFGWHVPAKGGEGNDMQGSAGIETVRHELLTLPSALPAGGGDRAPDNRHGGTGAALCVPMFCLPRTALVLLRLPPAMDRARGVAGLAAWP
jgi:hypothetical protein